MQRFFPLLALFLGALPLAGVTALGLATPVLADDSEDSSSDDEWGGLGGDDDDDDDDDRPQPRPRAAAPAPSPPQTLPDEIVVGGISEGDLALILADGFAIIASAPVPMLGGVIARLAPPPGVDLAAARERIGALAPAAVVELNHLYRPVEMPCRAGDCRAFEMIGWAVPPESCALGETIGMIDTVVNAEHEALRDQAIEIVSVLGEADVRSEAIHGTAIATLLVGSAGTRTPGLLPEARLVAVEAFHGDSAGDAADVFKIVRGLDALQQRDVRVANLSFAGPANGLLERAVAAASEAGMIVVAASGNAGPLAPPAFPAAYPPVVAVTAVDRDLEVYRQAGRGDHVAFAAPGVGVWTAASISGGRFRSGTSYATPFVSAAIAVAVAREPLLAGPEIIASLAAASADLGEAGRDPVFGWGLVSAPGCDVASAGQR